jgi:hypothetical protein
MKTDNFDEIVFRKPKVFNKIAMKQKECIAFDTETFNGTAFLLCSSNDNYVTSNVDNLVIKEGIKPNTFKDMIEHLYTYDKSLNVFFNLEYDDNALLKHLPYNHLEFYTKFGYTIYENYYISGIPGKSIDIAKAFKVDSIIKLSNDEYQINLNNGTKKVFKKEPKTFLDINLDKYVLGKKIKFFDIWQFFKYENSSSLNNVSKKYLNDEKKDTKALGYDISNLPLDKNIIDYCLQDTKLTQRLTDMIIKACNDIGLVFNTPYSCATISSDYFYVFEGLRNPYLFLWQYGNNVSYKNLNIFRYAYYSYKGGRTEIVKRGYFENCYEYDVNSMYPSNMCKLYDLFDVDWNFINGTEFKNYDKENIAYAFLRCNIKLKDNYINPLPYKHNGYYIYGYGYYPDYYITLPEYETIMNNNLGEIEILDGYIGLKTESNCLVFNDIVNKIYDKRKSFDKGDFRNSLFKIILNSIYGRYIEVNINKNLDNDDIDLLNDDYDIIEDNIVRKSYNAGKHFCPVYACYITALSRCKLFDTIYPQKEDFIGGFTDSIISEEKINNLDIGSKMGQWEKNSGELTMIGSGVYRLVSNDVEKLRTRGFHIKENINDLMGYNGISLDDLLVYGCSQTKVKKLKESVIQDKPLDFNTFVTQYKTLDYNFDKKRNWEFDYNRLQDIYGNICTSNAINIDELKLRM